ncbi:hypothetical protein [Ruthenibacterium lactatiformans]
MNARMGCSFLPMLEQRADQRAEAKRHRMQRCGNAIKTDYVDGNPAPNR